MSDGGMTPRRLSPLVAILAALVDCGGDSSTFRPAYAPENAPLECRQMVDAQASAQCLAGDGEACSAAVRRLVPDITFADSMSRVFPAVHDARMSCIFSYTTRGCDLGSASACMTLADALTLVGEDAAAKGAWRVACDRGSSDACWAASGVGRTKGPMKPPTDDELLLAERACDTGSYRACIALGDLMLFGQPHPADPFDMIDRATRDRALVVRGLDYWERACLRVPPDRSDQCYPLRQMLMLPHAPRRGLDDWLPFIVAGGLAPRSGPVPSPAESGGICQIDPSACPQQKPHVIPVVPLPPPGTDVLGMHRAQCARGNKRECLRLVELQILRFDQLIVVEMRNLAGPPALDAVAVATDLCRQGVADACVTLTLGGMSTGRRPGGLPELVRACELGAPLGCALAGHRLRADRRDPQASAGMLARACSGGVRWACGLR
jgi:hypothetical protein